MSLKKIVYLTEAQLNTLFSNGTVTVGGVTVTYSADDLYVTPGNPGLPSVTVSDNGKFLRVAAGSWQAVGVGVAEEASF